MSAERSALNVERCGEAGRAVFLSYASQDADAARRVCEALRAGGIDVWFDADGGLEHGDEWDAKIRRQIKECVLFIPIISAATQARHEGYFRIEWELAAQRAMGIASGVAFILPIVIDDTREPDALVPDRFRTVQWTRLRGGEVPPEVKARYLKLWSHRTGVLKHAETEPGRTRPVERDEGAASPAPASVSRRVPAAAWMAAMVAIAAVVGFVVLRPKSENGPGTRPTASEAINGGGSRPEVAARLAKVRPLREKLDVGRAELDAAAALLDQAAKLDPTDAEVWAEWSLLDCRYVGEHLDRSPERIDSARQRSIRATQLDPRSRTV